MSKLSALLLLSIEVSALARTYGVTVSFIPGTVQAKTVVTGAIPTAPPTLVSAYLVAQGDAHTIAVGRTLQFTAYGTYSDGSVVAADIGVAAPMETSLATTINLDHWTA